MLHSDFFPEFPCGSELVPVEAVSTEKISLLWCSGCGTEFTHIPVATRGWQIAPIFCNRAPLKEAISAEQ